MKCPSCETDNPSESLFCSKCGTQLGLSKDAPLPTKTIETPRKELTTGSTFAGRYQIIEELGRGGMGRVYKAIDTEVDEKIALKLIKPEIAADKKTIERFRNELKYARKIRHKNVCQMYDLSREEGSYYITMEFVPGDDLKSLIRRMGRLSPGQAITITKQVCDGLAEAHKLGVVHRDLKPQNIMIDQDGNARIMDFGIARSLEGKGITGAGVMIGTPDYMSPEQVEGKETDQRSDIYSLGVILYEMVTGQAPFEGDTPFTIGVKHKSEAPKDPKELNSQIPDDLSRIILNCLEKEKDKRYQSAEELRSELKALDQGMPTTEKIIPKRKPLTSREITVTFGVKRLIVPALIFLAIIITGIILWRTVFDKGAPLLPTEKHSIAVISFRNQTGDQAYDYLQDTIPNLLITSLEQSGYFQVTTWERLHDLLKQLGKEDTTVIDQDLGFELCRMEDVDAIVLGFFTKAGNMFATDVKVLDINTKNLLKTANSKGEGEGSILRSQIDELSAEISRGIGISESKINASQIPITEVTTSSMEAYEYYIRGKTENEKFQFERSRLSLEKAVELDPNFAMAFFWLAITYDHLGDTKTRDEAVRKAKLFSDNVTERERLMIDGVYAIFAENDMDKWGNIIKMYMQKFPKEKLGHYWMGLYFYLNAKFDEAIECFNRALELDPNYGEAINQIAYSYSDLEDFDKAIEYFERYAEVSPGDPNPYDSLGEVYFSMGRLDESMAKYKKALEVDEDFFLAIHALGYVLAFKENSAEAMEWCNRFLEQSPSTGTKAEAYMWRGFYHYWLGQAGQALSDLQVATELAKSVANERWIGNIHRLLGWIYYDRGELELSRESFKKWLDMRHEIFPFRAPYNAAYTDFCLGLVDVKEGQIASARERLEKLKSLLPDMDIYIEDIKFGHDFLLGEILLAEDSIDEAIAINENASPLGSFSSMYVQSILAHNYPFQKDVLARAYVKKGETEAAIAEYERLITFDPSTKERYLIHPLYHFRLAKLYEAKGWQGKAIEQHEKFLELWKDADPGTPEVEDAKARLASLQ
ncbi:MAG: protein kinase [Candidatus Aminicenantes bacterium]|nr:MAG: protein kinase [Candidatus Aminicenantes bacterium]